MSDIKESDRPKYHVIDHHTGLSVGSYFNKTRARNEVDKRDNAYGGYKHHVEERHPQNANQALKQHGADQSYDEISRIFQQRMKDKK